MTLSTGNSPASIKPGCYRGCGASILFVQMGPRKDTITTYPIPSRILYPEAPLLSIGG